LAGAVARVPILGAVEDFEQDPVRDAGVTGLVSGTAVGEVFFEGVGSDDDALVQTPNDGCEEGCLDAGAGTAVVAAGGGGCAVGIVGWDLVEGVEDACDVVGHELVEVDADDILKAGIHPLLPDDFWDFDDGDGFGLSWPLGGGSDGLGHGEGAGGGALVPFAGVFGGGGDDEFPWDAVADLTGSGCPVGPIAEGDRPARLPCRF